MTLQFPNTFLEELSFELGHANLKGKRVSGVVHGFGL